MDSNYDADLHFIGSFSDSAVLPSRELLPLSRCIFEARETFTTMPAGANAWRDGLAPAPAAATKLAAFAQWGLFPITVFDSVAPGGDVRHLAANPPSTDVLFRLLACSDIPLEAAHRLWRLYSPAAAAPTLPAPPPASGVPQDPSFAAAVHSVCVAAEGLYRLAAAAPTFPLECQPALSMLRATSLSGDSLLELATMCTALVTAATDGKLAAFVLCVCAWAKHRRHLDRARQLKIGSFSPQATPTASLLQEKYQRCKIRRILPT